LSEVGKRVVGKREEENSPQRNRGRTAGKRNIEEEEPTELQRKHNRRNYNDLKIRIKG
jgi:hypothetical protein